MLKKLSLILFLFSLSAAPTQNRDLANEIYNFVHKHAIRDEFDPLQYAYNDPYELHRIAGVLYRGKDLCKAPKPDSVWARGAYKPFTFLVKAKHESIITRIGWMYERCK